jgi:hypothetical protein
MVSVELELELSAVDTASIAAGLAAARASQVQLALAGKMLKINAEAAQSVVKVLDAAQENMARLMNAAAGMGAKVDISV